MQRTITHTAGRGRQGGGGVVGLCTGVEIRGCGNEVGGFAAGGRVLGLRGRTAAAALHTVAFW